MKTPYYAVIFSSTLTGHKPKEYEALAERMENLARSAQGFLGLESARSSEGFGVTVSYWSSMEALKDWKRQLDHREAQRLGRELWYQSYSVKIARVEQDYSFEADSEEAGADLTA